MATFNKFNTFTLDLGSGLHDFTSDTLKVALTNTAPVATNSTLSNITQITAGNGYTAGGSTATISSFTQSSGTATLALADVVFTASGGAINTFRYAVLYNDTSTGDRLIGWVDNGSTVDVADTETFTVDFAASSITI